MPLVIGTGIVTEGEQTDRPDTQDAQQSPAIDDAPAGCESGKTADTSVCRSPSSRVIASIHRGSGEPASTVSQG